MGLFEKDGIRLIGLTGQSGAGKSTVSKIFEDNGFFTVDADKAAHEAMNIPQFLEEAGRLLPDCISDGSLDRKKVAFRVFSDRELLSEYEKIIYPYILRIIMRRIAEIRRSGGGLILLDAPTLFQSGLDGICSVIVSVVAPMDLKIARILERDGVPVEMVSSRISSQQSDKWFREKSDYTIVNNAELSDLVEKTLAVIEGIRENICL